MTESVFQRPCALVPVLTLFPAPSSLSFLHFHIYHFASFLLILLLYGHHRGAQLGAGGGTSCPLRGLLSPGNGQLWPLWMAVTEHGRAVGSGHFHPRWGPSPGSSLLQTSVCTAWGPVPTCLADRDALCSGLHPPCFPVSGVRPALGSGGFPYQPHLLSRALPTSVLCA